MIQSGAVKRTAGLGALVLASSLLLTGCGEDEKEPKADDRIPCGAKERRTEPLNLATAADALAAAGEGALSQRYRMEVSRDGRTAVQEGVEEYDEDGLVSSELIIAGQAPWTRILYVDGLYYVSGMGITPQHKYAVIDPENTKDPLAGPMKEALSTADAGSALNVAQWQAGLAAVRFLGEEELPDGSPAEHYQFDVDPRLPMLAAGETPPRGLPSIVTYDVWVDDWNLMRRIENKIEDTRTLITLSGYCEDVEIPVPDADDIVERATAAPTTAKPRG